MPDRIHVLILEDRPTDAELVVHELRAAGFDPVWRRVDTEENFLAFLHPAPDVILADYIMPQFNAVTALKRLRESGLEIPVVIVSGSIGEETAVEAIRHGAVDYLIKDRLSRLGPAVRNALEQKRLRNEKRTAEAALQAAQQRLLHLLAHSPAVIYSFKLQGQELAPTVVSENIVALLGFTFEEALRPAWWQEQLCPEDREPARASLLNVLTHNTSNVEYRLRHKNGGYRWVADSKQIVRDASGQPLEIVGVWTDITERRQLEEQLRQSQKMEAIGQLAGGVAHDFNNLLTVIRGYTELLLLRSELDEGSKEELNEVYSATERAAHLISQLLTFSRKQVLQRGPLDLNEVVNDLSRMLGRVLNEDIHLSLHCAESLPSVHADAGLLEQVLLNLALNARDAMPRGGHLSIGTAALVIDSAHVQWNSQARPGTFVCLTVRDSGCGMTPEIRARIFEPFFTTKSVGQGTGLGLAMAYGIIKQHEGWIEVESQVGVGTAFRVLLPSLADAMLVPRHPALETDVPGGNETILLVEDDLPVRNLARTILKLFGYQVVEASSGALALSLWDKHADIVDLLLTDVVMPGGVNGHELAQELSRRKPGLKVIYTSGHIAGLASENVRQLRQANFLQKPYDPRKLAQMVRRCLDENTG
jgi:two-component system cell cycle sensor histidine kinase/response regulator CckA